ncbi:MAG: CopD family protein, partial [Thiotrichaceae bacterium]|nr:CopD family protein [Thiotrichaceae bacterium]
MKGLANFLDSLTGGVDLTFFSMAFGGLLWGLFILKPWVSSPHNNEVLVKRCIRLIYIGSYALIITQLCKIVLKLWLMTATLGRWPLADLVHTLQFQASCFGIIFALLLTLYVNSALKHHIYSKRHWIQASLLALLLACSGAWLVHGASRLENSEILMFLTVLHQVAAATWIGGIFQLLLLWKLTRQSICNSELWPILLWRFSTPGIIAVITLVASGLIISLHYVDSLNGLIGTEYGNLLLVKILMLAVALSFATANRKAVQHYFLDNNRHSLTYQVPHYLEAETLVLITILFTAASLASQPPAIDIPFLTADWKEVLNTFTPRIPRTTSPTHEAL